MKRFIPIVLAVVFLPVTEVHAQWVVEAPGLEALTAANWVKQAADMATQIKHFVSMIKNMEKQIENYAQNIGNIENVRGFNDFMGWFNRQPYLERMTEEAFNDMNVTIGKKNYKLYDIEGMAYGLKEKYAGYWDKEFTEEQRKNMWVGLGMSPANYAYVQTWNAREQQIAREFLSARAVHNKEYKEEMERNKEKLDALERDRNKSDNDPTKMGEKGVAVINAETNIANNKVLHDIHGALTDIKEKMAVDMYQNKAPSNQLPMSMWDDDVFTPLDK